MEANITDYLIMGISSPYAPEQKLANSLNHNNQYCLISIGEKYLKKCTAIDEDVIFILINPDCNHSDCNHPDDFTTQLGELCLSKKVIFYLHKGDIEKANLKTIISEVESRCTDIQKIKFSHESSDPKYGPYKKMLENMANNINDTKTFKGHIEILITESLKIKNTPHLIALSILCQGYLAAHWKELGDNNIESVLKGWGNLPNELREKLKGKKEETEDINKFWLPVIKSTENVRNELSDGNDTAAVNALLDAIDKKNRVGLKGNRGIKIVKDANEALLGILKGNEKQC